MDMIEKVARALCAVHGIDPDERRKEINKISFGGVDGAEVDLRLALPNWERRVKEARAAIAAMCEPTREMVDYCDRRFVNDDVALMGYHAMIQAALGMNKS